MLRYRPRRELIDFAIQLAARSEKGKAIVVIDRQRPSHSVSIDAALLVIKKSEMLRDTKNAGNDLRAIVKRAAAATGFAPERRYAYELVAMRYYNLLSQYAAYRRRQRKLPRHQRDRLSTPEQLFALTG